ncbi:MAG: tyrosine-type recombinase/integrase [Candidatus Angelobacter sp.]
MRKQNGCIFIKGDKWALRWRETAHSAEGEQRKMRFKIIGEVTAEHRRNKDRNTSKLRIPPEIKQLADEITGAANTSSHSVLLTLGELAERIYFPEKKQSWKPSSAEANINRWKRYLKHRVSSHIVRDFERKDAASLWKEIRKEHPNLSRQTFKHIRFLLWGMYEFAKDNGLHSKENPASAKLPDGLPASRPTQAYAIEEVARMLSLFSAHPQAQAVVALAFGSGMRKGELAGIGWHDYERTDDGAVLHVRRSSWRGKLQTPKTESSADDTAIDNEICEYIEAYRQLLSGVTEGLMFCYEDGRPINLDSFARWQIKPILKKAGIAWKGWHAFRRGSATYLAKKHAGDGTAAAASLLRHSDSSTTADHYIKNTKQERRTAQAEKVISIRRQRTAAAATIGAGLKQASVN